MAKHKEIVRTNDAPRSPIYSQAVTRNGEIGLAQRRRPDGARSYRLRCLA
jgi:hypothetical protein